MAPTLVKRYGKGADSDATDTLVAHSLTSEGHDASEDGSGRGTPLIADTVRSHPRPGSNSNGNLVNAVGVRRLTPTECERLQALPDGWTKLDSSTPDSRRYSALGDAVTASVAEWIGGRLLLVHEREPETAG